MSELDLQKFALSGVHAARPLVIAGPCSAETEAQVMDTAAQLHESGVQIFRAGVWKPRTKPGGFEGQGEKALPWLKRVKQELGMLICTEVATAKHVELALKEDVDILWLGARTTVNPFAVQEIADALRGVDIPILYKNPVNPDLELWIGGMQRINRSGVRRMAAIHRGFTSYHKSVYRNMPLWNMPIELRRRIPDLPIFCDPSHIGGNRNFIGPLAQQAMDLGFDGLIVESHCRPEGAWSDASQQVTPCELNTILRSLVIRDTRDLAESLSEMRQDIDVLDNKLMEILSHRMRICREIAEYKKQHNIAVMQPIRYSEILSVREAQGASCLLSADCVKRVFEAIHSESIRQQMDIINERHKVQ